MTELTEVQFDIIRALVTSDTQLVFMTQPVESDPADKVEQYKKIKSDIDSLVENGFLKNVTENFTETIKEAKRQNLRSFEAFGVTESAVSMFRPKEGLVN